MWWLAAMLVPAAPAVEADRAGNHLVPFAAVGEAGADARHCTPDRRWCARLRAGGDNGGWTLEVTGPGAAPARTLDQPADEDASDFAIRDHAVEQADGALLIGIEWRRSAGYSGGGASATTMRLVRVEPSGDPAPMLEVPIAASKDIRACFGDRDRRARRDACADRYEFSATLALDPDTTSGPPRFILTTNARTYPGRRTLDTDSTTAPPLTARDLACGAIRSVPSAASSRSTRRPRAILPTCHCRNAPTICSREDQGAGRRLAEWMCQRSSSGVAPGTSLTRRST